MRRHTNNILHILYWLYYSVVRELASQYFSKGGIHWTNFISILSVSSLIVFGGICLLFSIKDIQLFIKGPSEKMHWWFTHIAAMGAAYIATVTAFLVVNIHFLPGIVVWLTPTIAGGTLIGITISKYKKRFAIKTKEV